ncbi:hypothetical protein GCM10027417_24110 [Glutamicibacter endophyticus]
MSKHTHNHPTPTTGIWEGLYETTFRSAFARSKYRGYIKEHRGPIRFNNGGLGAWYWERTFPKSETRIDEHVVLHILLDPPSPKHHGDMSRENIIAHMLMHVDRGSQCSAIDPQHWNEECKAVEWEAMNRMGWAPANCDNYDPETGEWTEYLTGEIQ